MRLVKQKVSIMRKLFILPITILLLFSAQHGLANASGNQTISDALNAKKKWYEPHEIGQLKIKQTNDGTGIIKDVTCGDCDFKFVKITPDTKVIVNSVEVELLRARERAGMGAYIEFDRDTAEVKYIYWAE